MNDLKESYSNYSNSKLAKTLKTFDPYQNQKRYLTTVTLLIE